jgi:aerobic-type carbon monoxide dehydrogenase small subunit (CoxS/CutS family)
VKFSLSEPLQQGKRPLPPARETGADSAQIGRTRANAYLYNLALFRPHPRHFHMLIKFTLNGDPVEVHLKAADRLLVDVLREDLQMTGTKHGCGIGACGTCTVIVDGAPVSSCLQLAALCDGSNVRTIEGLDQAGVLHPVQQAFINRTALQCGICIPGHVMQCVSLIEKNPNPTDEEIRASADSVYCRCTGYVKIMDAYREAAALLKKAGKA